MRRLPPVDELIASLALALMTLIPLVEIALRPLHGKGIDNAPLLVQHLGLALAMFGGVLAERGGHLTALGNGLANARNPALRAASTVFAKGSAAILCGMLAAASWRFVASEMDAGRELAYGLPVWWVQALMPAGFLILGARLGSRCAAHLIARVLLGLALTGAGFLFADHFDGTTLPLIPFAIGLLAALLTGAPIFAVLGGLALALFWSEGQPLASVSLSHYQITVNPSLPALPLFTLAGLVFARSGAAGRLGTLFTACFGGGSTGTAIAAALLCSFFTAFTGGSGVTILALGGLLLPLLKDAGFPERKGISLVTSASALGVLLAPSVPLIMYAIIARVPINTMFLAGVLPALVMVVFLLIVGGYLRRSDVTPAADIARPKADLGAALAAAWAARWELLAPVVAIGSLVSGLATPTESAALTAAYAILTQAIAHRELDFALLRRCLADCAQVIGGVMLILGMALGLTNYLVDAGIPDAAVEWVQATLPNKFAFLVALNVFLFLAGALMEIYAAIVVLVPLLLPVAVSYGIDPVHFGVIFLAVMEMGFLCPPAGMNIFFASAMFGKPIREVAVSVLPALLAIFLGALAISWTPELATALPSWLGSTR
jgi:C4-dicarboxylate transporter, DctM subunit